MKKILGILILVIFVVTIICALAFAAVNKFNCSFPVGILSAIGILLVAVGIATLLALAVWLLFS